MKTLVDSGSGFIVIGTMNALYYKEIFPLIKDNKVWFGYNKPKVFIQPDGSEKKFGNVVWYTNLDIEKRHEKFFKPEEVHAYYEGNEENYPKYDNYDAIDIGRVQLDGTRVGDLSMLPIDYKGVMGVPVSFFDRYSPEEFEILGMCENKDLYGLKSRIYTTEECKQRYFELFGKKGTYDMNASGVINGRKTYSRLLIRNLHPVPRAIDEAM